MHSKPAKSQSGWWAQRLRVVGRLVAFGSYLLCYGLAGAGFAWLAEIFVAGWLGLKVGDVSERVFWLSGALGFAIALLIAWRSATNRLAHGSIFVVGSIQTAAAAIACQRLISSANGDFIGNIILASIMFWIAVLSGIAALGGCCGYVARALSNRPLRNLAQPFTAESHPPPASLPETLPVPIQRRA